MKKIAYVFPGQGAQYVGMGKPLFERYQIFKDVFIRAGDLLHMDLSRICLEGPSVELDKTENTQVALLVYGYAAFQVMTQEYGIRPNYMAGHSVGEITALVCSGAIDFEDGVKMVRVRGELMRGAGHGAPGGMAAVIGGAIEEVEAVCAEVSTRLYPLHVGIANINSSGQCVISGGVAGVSEAGDALARRGARVVPLNVSAAYHSRYMKTASEQFKRELDTYRFRPAQYPVVSNMDTGLYSDNSDMPALLSKHMTAPVLWSDTMTYLADHDVRYVIELGPKNTLCRFFGDFPDIPAWPIDNDEEMNAMLARLGQDCAIWIKQFMAVCVGTENLNSDAKAYEEGAVKPYRRLEETVGRIESGEWLPYGEILRQAFNDMKKVLAAKRVPRCEMEEIYGDLELSDQLMKERHT